MDLSRLFLLPALAFVVLLVPAPVLAQAEPEAVEFYQLDYRVRLRPRQGLAVVVIEVRQPRDLLREVRFRRLPGWHDEFSGDGDLELSDEAIIWRPPPQGGRLRLEATIDHRRGAGGFDSLLTDDWGVFRGDDLVPPAAVRSVKGARAQARLQIDAPEGWSSVTAFPKDDGNWYLIDDPERNFDRPVGWMAAGKIGVRRDTVAGVNVAVAGPAGQDVRRLDILAFLNWNLPVLEQVFPDFPKRVLIVSAGDPMWRGGLSGPDSLFIHADRPLISENGTSTLMHELVHLAQGYSADPGGDWIVEGIAEYYSIEIMRRSGTLSPERARRALAGAERWGRKADSLKANKSSGAVTARAVTLLAQLDAELIQRSGGESSLDDVVRALSERGERVNLRRLQRQAEKLVGGPLDCLNDMQKTQGSPSAATAQPGKRPARVSRGS